MAAVTAHRASGDVGRGAGGWRRRGIGGVVGPAAFIGAWATGAVTTSRHYSSIHDAISRLAAVGAPTRPLMTTGFVVFGAAVPVFATALRQALDGPAWITATATGLATLAVAATPLEHSSSQDAWHAVFAGFGYVTLAATPLLANRSLVRTGHRRLAAFGLVAGSIASISLLLTTTGLPTGLFQRLGLSAGDVWIATTGVMIATGRLGSDRDRASHLVLG